MHVEQALRELREDEHLETVLLVAIWDELHELNDLRFNVRRILERENRIMATQDDINAVVTQLQADDAGLATAAEKILAEIAALQTANPAVDVTGLQAAAAALEPHVQAIVAIPPADVPPPA